MLSNDIAMFKFLAGCLLIISLVGCATVPMGNSTQDELLKRFNPKSDVAGIYIYRNESIGFPFHMDVEVDGNPLGQTAAHTYFYTEVPPGTHTVTSKAENSDTIQFNTVAGKLYYIWQEVKMGVLTPRTKLHLVSEEEGKKGVLDCKLAASK